jgi:hypothetical protein
VALFDIPTNLPFNLGNLQYPEDIRAQGTFVLPKNIPWTLSALPPKVAPPYGSVGWEVVVRQHDNFDSIILKTNNYSGLLFSDEEDSVGGGSVTFNLDDELFSKNLLNGRPAADLYERENLWQAYFDGELRASWLGTNVKETQLQDSEVRQVTISGPGPAQVLEWAAVLPAKFPIVIPKLETFQDPISGELVDTSIWNNTSVSGLSVFHGGGREEAQAQIDIYNEDLQLLQTDKTNAQQNVNTAQSYYNSIIKSGSYTQAEKNQALKDLNDAKAVLVRATLAVGLKEKQILDATIWRNIYPTPIEPNLTPSIKLTVNSADVTRTIAASPFDLISSGFSAWVDPLPQTTSSTGQAITTLMLKVDDLNYAKIYTQLISGRRRLVAEVRTVNEVKIKNWDYSPINDKYWRIREVLGEIVFETAPDFITFTERFRATYGWDASSVQLNFSARLEGSAGLTLPISAFIGDINLSIIPESLPLFSKFDSYLAQAQVRGVIPYVTTTWSELEDSAGAGWSSIPTAAVDEGVDLLKVLQTFSTAQQATWRMKPDFSLDIRQKVWAAGDPDPTLQYHKEGSVVFHETGSQLFRERSRTREDVANYIVGKNSAGEYAITLDDDSIDKYQRRELFVSAGNSGDLDTTSALISSTLESVKEERNSWRIKVDADQPGRRVFLDYGVGDWIGIENTETGNIDAWKVVGIAISVSEEGETDLELTLQSRLELLAERLKFQIEKLGGSSNSAGVVVSNPITAATLIQQSRLSNLLDVALSSPEDGDVLSYNKSGGFWTAVRPGDKTVPETPEILETYTTTYQSGEDIWTKAQVQLGWSTPLNTDGSTISDGHHYEIRFRPDQTSPYSATWDEASTLTWNNAQLWSQPTTPEISNSAWQAIYVGFDDNQSIIQELTPGVKYEFQIRAVDSSTPQHFSEWSASVVVVAASDTVAPPTPAVPLVASSRLAIQVTHTLGKFTGGDYNLPEDMDHLEIHVGGPEFFPTEETRLAKIPATLSMMRGRIPAIGTVQVENTDDVWVSVVAVDRTGNRSMGSPPVTASVNLIDDAHISDLTATKITAGIISSSIVLAGIIKTAETGARAEMDSEGFRIYTDDGDPTVSLVGSPGLEGNFLLIKDPENTAKTLAGIDGSGRGSFQNIYVVDDITIGGSSLIEDIINPRAKGVVALGTYAGAPYEGGGPGGSGERGFMEISFIAEESRSYMITAITEWESTIANDNMVMRLRDAGTLEPRLSMPWMQQARSQGGTVANANRTAIITHSQTFTPGLHRILWSFFGSNGNATVQADEGAGVESTSLIWVEDIGLPQTDTALINDAGVPVYLAPAGESVTTVRPLPKITYTKDYSATWSGTYRSGGDYSSSHGVTMVQGNSGDGYLGDARGLVGFNDAQIRKDLAGATIKACYITLYANHWWENNGGTARIGTHRYSSRPSVIGGASINSQRVTSGSWPKPGKRKVSLGTTIGNEFKSGTTRGIMVGGTNGSNDQYGKFNGNGQSNEPVLTIVYTK